ncbi:MAG: class B sortase [Eubacterium sp.]|nr:class B sortase [Eubacterium sp.]
MKKIILTVILVICLGAVAFSLWKLWGFYQFYHKGKKEYDQLTEYVKEEKAEESTEGQAEGEKKDKCPVTVDFEGLRKVNPDVVGWLHIPDTGINYPIVQTKDNDFYLHRTFKKENSYIGAIFLDAVCKSDFGSFNNIIYGHNLKNGEMFGHLKGLYDKNYNSEADFKKHPKVWVITPNDNREYLIFAAREINVEKDMDVYTVEFPGYEEYRTFLDDQMKKSQYDTKVIPSEKKSMITLSTCTSRTEEGRFIVQATRIQ